jgi:hypothetical protein
MTRRSLRAVLPLAAAAQLLACGGGSSSTPPAPLPHTSVAVPAATGGTVTLSGGAAVQIPAGALATDTTVTVQQLATAPTGAVGAAYDLGPSGTTFSQPVTVTIPVPAGTPGATVWTKPAGASTFTSLPTTVSGGVASAQTSHFSVFVVGPVDMNGTWAGPVTYAVTNGNGTPAPNVTQMQSRDIVQDLGNVTIQIGNSNGFRASCSGTLQGDVLDATCTGTTLDGSCTAQYPQGGTVTATTWVNASSLTWPGGACGGQTFTAQHSPLAKQPGPAQDIAGTYARTAVSNGTTTSGSAVRTQATGSSLFDATVTMNGGTTHSCKGIVIADSVYSGCYTTVQSTRYNAVAQGTIHSGPPLDIELLATTTTPSNPSYLSTTSISDVKQ